MQKSFTRMDRDCNLLVNSRKCEGNNNMCNMKKNGLDNRTRQMKNIDGVTPKDENENSNHSSTMLFHHYQTMNNLKRETNVDRDNHFQPASPTRRDMAELSHIFQLYNVANARKPYSSTKILLEERK